MFIDIVDDFTLWEVCIQIYRDSFPAWEREDEANILKNIKNGSYKMFVYTKYKEVVGFYILDINLELNYALFSFLAIKESDRGLGLGSQLCLDAIEYFHKSIDCDWFFIEAEVRQAALYAKLGFKALEIDYRVPAFNSKKSVKMSLMLIEEKTHFNTFLRPIIEDIFLRGYSLNRDDIRLVEQLKRVVNS